MMGGRGCNSSAVVNTNQVSGCGLSVNDANSDKYEEEQPSVHCAVVAPFLKSKNYSRTSPSWHDSLLHKIPCGENLSQMSASIKNRFEDEYNK